MRKVNTLYISKEKKLYVIMLISLLKFARKIFEITLDGGISNAS